MTRFTLLACGLLAFVGLVGAAQDKQQQKLDPSKLVGRWEYASGKKAGEEVPKDHLMGVVTFTKDEIHIPAGPDQKFVMSYKLNADKSPVQIDMEIKEGPAPAGGKASGIIALEKEELKLCYVPEMGEKVERPDKFESTEKNRAFYFVMKRAKEKVK
jgi:uncharacterized protein (TIGR03067 family)